MLRLVIAASDFGGAFMKRIVGRNIYITDLKKVLAKSGGPAGFAARAKDSQFSAVWIRIGRGPGRDRNLELPELPAVQGALANAGVELWGWHVPFCANAAAAESEAGKVLEWAEQFALAGVLLDAEKTSESPRFRGGRNEARIYAEKVRAGVAAKGRGIALSSHDQPSLHTDLPFDVFLSLVEDNCPQVYYQSKNVANRFNKSVHDYTPLEAQRDFKDRYKPTGNITMSDDLPLPDVATCLSAANNFINLVKTGGFGAYSFWCWDTAPEEIFEFFRNTPV
jgi:hypothetical protein